MACGDCGGVDGDVPHEVDRALREAGFELMEAADLAVEDPAGIPWYEPLRGSGLSLANFRSSGYGRVMTHCLVWTFERIGIVPRGTLGVSGLLNMAAAAFARAGRLGIFTPMYFVVAGKPDSGTTHK